VVFGKPELVDLYGPHTESPAQSADVLQGRNIKHGLGIAIWGVPFGEP
jgi:hypothetical protein